MILLIDIGNTNTVCAIHNGQEYINYERIELKNTIQKKIKEMRIYDIQDIAISSVVPELTQYFITILSKEFNIKPFIISYKNAGLKLKVDSSKEVGNDRLCNIRAAIALTKKNCLIIDFGTATTFDIVKNGVYEGGVIAPGIKLSIKNLSQSTALLPMFDLKNQQKSYGKNTIDALNSGFIWGYEGLINNIINKITKNWKMNYKIILTGGYANLFKKIIKRKSIVDQDITIKGASRVYREFL